MDTRVMLIAALIGHIICGVTDYLLTYSPKGRLDFKNIADADKMAEMFADMPLKYPLISMIIGTFSITLMSFGYFALSAYINMFSPISSIVMYISAVVFVVLSLHITFSAVLLSGFISA